MAGLTIAEANLRGRAGVSILAIARDGLVTGNPAADVRMMSGDRMAIIGSPAQIASARQLLLDVPDTSKQPV